MKYALKRTIFSGQEAAVRNHGDVVWEEVCNAFPSHFTIAEVAALPCLAGYTPRVARDIARAIIANVEAEVTDNPPFDRRGNRYYWSAP